MTDRQFLERMIFLTEKLCDLYNAEPLDQDARKAILIEVHEIGVRFNLSRRRRHWFMFSLICLLLLAFGWIIYDIFSYLSFRGPLP